MYIRAIYLAALIVVLLWSMLIIAGDGEMSVRQLASAGATSFTRIAYLQIFLICILAPVFMGGAIAQEANPRTWEVLLTTPMSAAEIVLGNLFGRLFFVIGLLVCSMPLFALTQYFGGVPGSAILASYLVAGCTALFVGALAIALSVSRLVGKRAFFVFYVAIVSYLGVTIAVDLALRAARRGIIDQQDSQGLARNLKLRQSCNCLVRVSLRARAAMAVGVVVGVRARRQLGRRVRRPRGSLAGFELTHCKSITRHSLRGAEIQIRVHDGARLFLEHCACTARVAAKWRASVLLQRSKPKLTKSFLLNTTDF